MKDKKRFFVRIARRDNENWFSFLSGIAVNIPITLMMLIQPFGNNTIQHVYFFVVLGGICITVLWAFCALSFTIKTISIREKAQARYDIYLSEHHNEVAPAILESYHNEECEKNTKKLSFFGWGFVILGLATVAVIITLWVLRSKF